MSNHMIVSPTGFASSMMMCRLNLSRISRYRVCWNSALWLVANSKLTISGGCWGMMHIPQEIRCVAETNLYTPMAYDSSWFHVMAFCTPHYPFLAAGSMQAKTKFVISILPAAISSLYANDDICQDLFAHECWSVNVLCIASECLPG